MSRRQHYRAVRAATRTGRRPTRKQIRAAYSNYLTITKAAQ